MVRWLITTYVMLTPEPRRQTTEEIQAKCAARAVAGLPPDSPEPEEDEVQLPKEEEGEPLEEADLEEDEAELPEQGSTWRRRGSLSLKSLRWRSSRPS